METICAYCTNILQADDPRCELQCHHFFHTRCVLENFAALHERCPTCQTVLLAPDENDYESVNEEYTEDDTNIIRTNALYDTNETFRKDVRKYIETQRECSKSLTSFRKLLTVKKNELVPQYTQIKEQIKQLFRTKKSEVTNTPEYKSYKSAQAKNTRLYRHLQKEYDLRRGGLAALRTKPGCRSIRRPFSWRYSPRWMINRSLHLRLPYY